MLAEGGVKKCSDAESPAKACGFDGKVLRDEISRCNGRYAGFKNPPVRS